MNAEDSVTTAWGKVQAMGEGLVLLLPNIDMPFPTQQILFHDQTEETDGDRSRQREGWPAGYGRCAQTSHYQQRVTSAGLSP
jgi:hypothetical protein